MAGKTAASILVELIDKASGPAQNIAKSLHGITDAQATKQVRKYDAAQASLGRTMRPVTAQFVKQQTAAYRVGVAMDRAATPARRLVNLNRDLARTTREVTTSVQRQARATRDITGGMGASGRRQLDQIHSNRRLVEGMGAPARAERTRGARAAQERREAGERRRNERAEMRRKRKEGRRGPDLQDVGPLAGVIGAYEGVEKYKEAAQYDRKLTMIGITADATAQQVDTARESIRGLARETAVSRDKIAGGLEALVAQGRSLDDSLAFLPSVARTAAASGSEVDDIAKTADSVGTNFEIAGKQMQKAFDIMAAGGKAGQFELKDMARYLPSLGPAASAIGFKGEKGLSDLVAMLQIMRKGSGTAEEAVSSMNNILAKMESDKTAKNFKALGVDSEAAFKKARKEGRNLVEVFEELVNTALKGDRSRLGEIIDDMEFKRGVQALMSYRGEWQKLSQTLRDTSGGTVAKDITKVIADSQAAVQRTEDAFKNIYSAAARAADKGGVSAGLEDAASELNSIAGAMERIGKAYDTSGVKGAFEQIFGDTRKGQIENRKAALEERAKQEDGRVGELEKARDAQRQKLEGEGRSPAEIADAMRIRDAEIAKARRRKGAVEKAQAGPDLADKKPLRMGGDPTAPLQGSPSAVGPGVQSFQEAFPLDISGRKPLPAKTPLPPVRPQGLTRTIERIEDVLSGGGPQGPGVFANQRAPLPPKRPAQFGKGLDPSITLPEISVEVDRTEIDAAKASADELKAKLDEAGKATIAPKADASGLAPLETGADAAKGKLTDLGTMSVAPTVNAGSIQSAIGLVDQLISKLAQAGGAAEATAGRVARAAGSASGALAGLERSKQTSMTSSPA